MEEGKKDEEDCQSESSEEWQDLSKSEYAKVIFTELSHHSDSGSVSCKFHITDEVVESPFDYVGLFRVGYEDLEQCIVSRVLSEMKGAADKSKKIVSCVFECIHLPSLEEGFYQFLYVSVDRGEICGASVPFEITEHKSDLHVEEEGDFLLVRTAEDPLLAQLHNVTRGLKDQLETAAELREQLRRETEQKEALQHKYDELQSAMSKKVQQLTEARDHMQVNYNRSQAVTLERDEEIRILKKSNVLLQVTHDHAVFNHGTLVSELRSEIERREEALCEHKERLGQYFKEKQLLEDKNFKMLEEMALYQKISVIPQPSGDEKRLSEQLEDHQCMVKALDHSKQMAIREIADLTHTLAHRTDSLNRMKHECAISKERVQEAEERLKQTQKVNSELEETLYETQKFQEEAKKREVILVDDCKKKEQQLQEATSTIECLTEEKNKLIEQLNSEKRDSKDAQVRELMGRLAEASRIYHKHLTYIDKLKRRLSSTTTTPPQGSTPRLSVSSSHISSDCDTGEVHRLVEPPGGGKECLNWKKKMVAAQTEEEATEITPFVSGEQNEEETGARTEPMIEIDCLATLKEMAASTPTGNLYPALKICDEASSKPGEMNSSCPCPLCPEMFPSCSYFDHLESVHRVRMCPFCGHLFDADVPQRYIAWHVRRHHTD